MIDKVLLLRALDGVHRREHVLFSFLSRDPISFDISKPKSGERLLVDRLRSVDSSVEV